MRPEKLPFNSLEELYNSDYEYDAKGREFALPLLVISFNVARLVTVERYYYLYGFLRSAENGSVLNNLWKQSFSKPGNPGTWKIKQKLSIHFFSENVFTTREEAFDYLLKEPSKVTFWSLESMIRYVHLEISITCSNY